MRKPSEKAGSATGDAPPSSGSDPAGQVEYRLGDSVAYQLRNTYKSFVQNLQPVLDQHNISIGMWYYLRALWEEDGLTQRQISERVGLVAPTTVEQLKNMEKRGLLERRRSVEDRRKIHVFLTAEGKVLKEKLISYAPVFNAVALEGLTPGEIGFLRLVLARMQQNLEAHLAKSGGTPGIDDSF
jgi:DNA-binding MarR family transcriptional regulator